MGPLLDDYRRMAKPRAIEEVGDIYLIRPLGFLLTQLFRPTPITPNMVSFLAVAAGWWTARLYYLSDSAGGVPSLALLGAFAFLLHSGLDSADGQLARVTGRTSPLGRIVDGFCDSLSFLAIYVAVLLSYWQRSGESPLLVALLGLAAMYSHSVQSSLTDYQRSLYMLCVHGKRDIVESDPRHVEGVAAAQGGLFSRLLHVTHLAYYRRQRRLLASTARLERRAIELLEKSPERAGELARVYERHQRPTMPGWALLASNSHKIGIIAASFVPAGSGSFWSGLGMGWYLLYDLALNGAMAALILRQAAVNERTMRELPRP